LPHDRKAEQRTVTRHFLNGHLIGDPIEYSSLTLTSFWFKMAALSKGRHVIRMETGYSVTRNDTTYGGTAKSMEYPFDIVHADVPDHLVLRQRRAFLPKSNGDL
jgi:hypothetical protein